MRALGLVILSVFCVVALSGLAKSLEGAEVYSSGSASRDGIGKFYMGREISRVMGHRGAGWLERSEREREERTDLLISGLPINPDSVVADIGAGTGYFTFPVARRASRGTVYAVDIQPEMLQIIRQRVAQTGLSHVLPVQGAEDNPNLPREAIDLAYIVDAYHEFSFPREMGLQLVAALKPGGLLALVEYRAEDPGVPIKPLHKMSAAQVKKEMHAIGLKWLRTENYLPQQHLLVFEKPRTRP